MSMLCAATLLFDSEVVSPSTNLLFFINSLETFQTVRIQVQRQSIGSPRAALLAAR